MSSFGNLLKVVMDGINDVDMILNYAEETDADVHKDWFKSHARKRLDSAIQDFDWVANTTGLNDRVARQDEIAIALYEHIEKELMRLKNRM